MTDDDKALVKRLRAGCLPMKHDAADRIEAQAAEIDRLRELIKVTGDHWLALQHKHPIQWEGAIDGAMAAACAEIEKLRGVVKDIQIEAEREKGNWTHLKQVIARKARAALAGKAEQ